MTDLPLASLQANFSHDETPRLLIHSLLISHTSPWRVCLSGCFCTLLQGFTSTSVSPCVAKSFATCCVHLQLWTTHLAEKQMSSCVTHSLQKIRQSYYHLWNKSVWSFLSFLLKLKKYLCFAPCMCIGTDHRFKCGLRSVLGHVWARPSFPLWPERTGKQSNLLCSWESFTYSWTILMFCGPNMSILASVSIHLTGREDWATACQWYPAARWGQCQPPSLLEEQWAQARPFLKSRIHARINKFFNCILSAQQSLPTSQGTSSHSCGSHPSPALCLPGTLQGAANSNEKIPGPIPSTCSQLII